VRTDSQLASESHSMVEPPHQFKTFSTFYDARKDLRETVYKSSRDVTMGSKGIISLLQRSAGVSKDNKNSEDGKDSPYAIILREARSELRKVHRAIESIFSVLSDPADYWRMLPSWGFGIQEYVEACGFYHYLSQGKLISKRGVEELIQSDHSSKKLIEIPVEDYLMGIGDIAGELMRYATNSACLGNYESPSTIASFLQELYLQYSSIQVPRKDWDKKVSVMLESLMKVETVCYKLQIRGKEFPKEILSAMLESSSFSNGTDIDMNDESNFNGI